jgi:glutathione peroxidase-family protein
VLEQYAAGDLYLVDPQGNVILKYPSDMPIAEVRKDIKKLLKLSQIG